MTPGLAPLTPLERLFVRAFIPIAAASWSGVLLAELGAFTLGRVVALAAAVTLAAWVASARDLRPVRTAARSPGRSGGVGLVLVMIAAALAFARPGEYLIEGADASVYVAIGRSIHDTGGLKPVDALASAVPAADRDAILSPDTAWPHALSRFPGGLHVAPDERTLVPDFFHLLPVWIAIFVGVAGPLAAYYVNVMFGLLAVLTVWLIGRRAWSPAAGTVAALLLVANFGEVWYARLVSSEMLAQWLLLAAIFFTMAARDGRSRTAAACAGTAVGLAAFTRIDALFIVVALAVGWLAFARRRDLLGHAWRWYAAALALVGGHALVHALTISWSYTARLGYGAWTAAASAAVRSGVPLPLVAAALVVGGAIAAVVLWRLPARTRVPTVAGGMLLVSAAFSAGVAASAGLLFTVPGIVAMLVGVGLAAWRDTEHRLLPLVALFACEAVLWLAWREQTTWPDDFRRFVPAVLPLGTLFIAGLTVSIARGRAWWRRAAWLMPAGLAAAWLVQASPVLLNPPMRGVHAQVEALARRVPASAVVLTDRSLPGHVSLALQSAFERGSLRLNERVSPEALRTFITRALASGHRMYVALGGYTVDAPRRLWRTDLEGLHVVPAGTVPMRFTTLTPSPVAFPRVLRTQEISVELYELETSAGARPAPLPLVIDLGERDFAFAVRGFHAGDAMADSRARWTSGKAQIFVPRLAVPAGGSVTLSLRLAAYRPAGLPRPTVQVSLDGIAVGAITEPGSGFSVYRFMLDGAATARLAQGGSTLVLLSDTFVPKAVGLNDDTRVLGVAVDWIRLE